MAGALDGAFGAIDFGGDSEPVAIASTVLFGVPLALSGEAIQAALRAYDPEMASAVVRAIEPGAGKDVFAARIAWGRHVIDLVGLNVQPPKQILDLCITAGLYDAETKRQAYEHNAHTLLYHCGPETDPLQRYAAVAAVIGVLDRFGATIAMNEDAHSSMTTNNFSADGINPANMKNLASRMDYLRNLPLPFYYMGFIKYKLPNTSNIWMRTYGGIKFGIPDLAKMTSGHEAGQETLDQFTNILGYIVQEGATVAAGHTMELFGANLRFRAPLPTDPPGASEGNLLVVENIAADQINKPPAPAAPAKPVGTAEQELTFEEMGALTSVGQKAVTALTTVTYGSQPDAIVAAIEDELRRYQKQQKSFMSKIVKPKPIDRSSVATGFGALWGHQLVRKFGWEWVKVTRNGKKMFGIASKDRSVIMYCAEHLRRCLDSPDYEPKVRTTFAAISAGRVTKSDPGGLRDILR